MIGKSLPIYGLLGVSLILLAACGQPDGSPEDFGSSTSPVPNAPDRPADADPAERHAGRPDPVPDRETAPPEPKKKPETEEDPREVTYWGIEPGEPLPIMWEDLMPEGAAEALIREQEAFYAMLAKRYAANERTLADAGGLEGIEEGSELDFMPQLGTFDTVDDLDGEHVKIPGYVVPFDFDLSRRQSTFLFVPYMGACIHTPPPPPNQIIFVEADPPQRIRDIWVPYWLEGELRTQANRNDLGNAAYTLSLMRLDPYPVP